MAAPSGPSSRPGRTRPGSRPAPGLAPGRGSWQAGAALPGGGGGRGDGVGKAAEAAEPSAPVRSDGGGVGAAGPRRQCLEGSTEVAPGAQERCPPTTGPLDPGLGLSVPGQPPARENPGPLPGAAALPGRAGEGIPGICPETAVASLGRIGPCMGSASAASAGKAPARTAGQGRACALRVSPPAPCLQLLGPWTASRAPTIQPWRSGDAGRVGLPGWDHKMPAQSRRGGHTQDRATNSTELGAHQCFFFPPPSQLGKKDNRN